MIANIKKIKKSYSSTQCPAVATQRSFRSAPPHLWVEENPKKEVLLTETCHGNWPNKEFVPLTILPSGCGIDDGTPHSENLKSNYLKVWRSIQRKFEIGFIIFKYAYMNNIYSLIHITTSDSKTLIFTIK